MTPTRYQISVPAVWGSFTNLREELDRLLTDRSPRAVGCSDASRVQPGWAPPFDLTEDKDNLVVQIELPGLRKEEISISLHDGVVTVSGERLAAQPSEGTGIHCIERVYGRFARSVVLPVPVTADGVKAVYSDGVLTLTLPKADHVKPRQISINA